ncbi:MAG: hypothetical protein U0174_18425 [Polyangiaceae bacterium]
MTRVDFLARSDYAVIVLPNIRSSTRGMSLVEVMNFLTLAAVLGTLAMVGVAKYLRHSKTAEAVGTLTTIGKSAAAFYNASDSTQPQTSIPAAARAMRHFPQSALTPVPEDASFLRGKRYRSSSGDWAKTPWRELNFSMPQPQYYRYDFQSSGVGATGVATVTAAGDLDGDGETSLYSLKVTPDANLDAQVAPNVEIKDGEE